MDEDFGVRIAAKGLESLKGNENVISNTPALEGEIGRSQLRYSAFDIVNHVVLILLKYTKSSRMIC